MSCSRAHALRVCLNHSSYSLPLSRFHPLPHSKAEHSFEQMRDRKLDVPQLFSKTKLTTQQTPGFDLTGYYPAAIKPAWMTDAKAWFVTTYGDKFFYDPP